MAQIRSTRYVCDACTKDVPKKGDLVRFTVRVVPAWEGPHFDVCDECEVKFLNVLTNYVPSSLDDELEGLRRKVKVKS